MGSSSAATQRTRYAYASGSSRGVCVIHARASSRGERQPSETLWRCGCLCLGAIAGQPSPLRPRGASASFMPLRPLGVGAGVCVLAPSQGRARDMAETKWRAQRAPLREVPSMGASARTQKSAHGADRTFLSNSCLHSHDKKTHGTTLPKHDQKRMIGCIFGHLGCGAVYRPRPAPPAPYRPPSRNAGASSS